MLFECKKKERKKYTWITTKIIIKAKVLFADERRTDFFLLGRAGNLLSGMVVVSPVPTFYRIYKNKSTESFDSFPYVVVLFSATMWVYYGILTLDILLLTINIGACIAEVTYLIIFLYYAPSKSRVIYPFLFSPLNKYIYIYRNPFRIRDWFPSDAFCTLSRMTN